MYVSMLFNVFLRVVRKQEPQMEDVAPTLTLMLWALRREEQPGNYQKKAILASHSQTTSTVSTCSLCVLKIKMPS
jgi:hypothetical protein